MKCCLFRRVLLLPSVFSLLNAFYNEQDHSLRECIETSLMLLYNKYEARWNHNSIYFIMHQLKFFNIHENNRVVVWE